MYDGSATTKRDVHSQAQIIEIQKNAKCFSYFFFFLFFFFVNERKAISKEKPKYSSHEVSMCCHKHVADLLQVFSNEFPLSEVVEPRQQYDIGATQTSFVALSH